VYSGRNRRALQLCLDPVGGERISAAYTRGAGAPQAHVPAAFRVGADNSFSRMGEAAGRHHGQARRAGGPERPVDRTLAMFVRTKAQPLVHANAYARPEERWTDQRRSVRG